MIATVKTSPAQAELGYMIERLNRLKKPMLFKDRVRVVDSLLEDCKALQRDVEETRTLVLHTLELPDHLVLASLAHMIGVREAARGR